MFIFENFGLLGKTLAKVGKMLSDQDFQNLLSLHSVPEIASYLQKTPAYQQVLQEVQPNEIHRRDLEVLINQSTIYELLSLREFASLKERIVIDFFLTGFEIENLKLVTKHVVLSTQASLGDIEKKLFDLSPWSKVDFRALLRSKSLDELTRSLEGTAFYDLFQAAKEQFSESRAMDVIENALDYWYLAGLPRRVKNFPHRDREAVLRFFGVQADLLNVELIYRMRFVFGMLPEKVYGLTIPLYRYFNSQRLIKLVRSQSLEEFMSMLLVSPYRSVFHNWQESSEVLDEIFERSILSYLYRLARFLLRKHLSLLEVLIAFITLKNFETRDLITVIEDIRYALDVRLAERYFIRPLRMVNLGGR